MLQKKIAIIDLNVTINSPAGSCVRSEILGLLELEGVNIDLYTSKCDISHPRLTVYFFNVFEQVLLLKYLSFFIQTLFNVKKGYDLIQSTQGQYPYSDITYAHFCHRAYLATQWHTSSAKGFRKFLRYLNHSFQSFFETISFKNSFLIVVPSEGLKREITFYYPSASEKIIIIPNPVDFNHFQVPLTFEKNQMRLELGFVNDDFVIVFSALGDFSRKGLDILFESLVLSKNILIKILVVGGAESEIIAYKFKAKNLNIENRVCFVGFKNDIRPYLWCGDIFSLPSSYETFSLVILQAAMSRLPVLVTKLYGVEEYIMNGINGWVVDRDSFKIAELLDDILKDSKHVKLSGTEFSESLKKYDTPFFQDHWKKIISDFNKYS
jgi:glycosyltransferase involved in cell wall biosynthesis